ncbi:MAG: MBL fold metallo-hydrolase [Bacteroidota bacterium]
MGWIIGLGIIALAIFLFLRLNPQFGGRISAADKARFAQSPQWDGKKFVNQTETSLGISLGDIPGLLRQQFAKAPGRAPQKPIKMVKFDSEAWDSKPDQPAFIWYGHSALLLRLNSKTLLIDPMLGPDAAPIAPIASKRYNQNSLALIDQLPQIDLLLMTHDHYDHLDYASIKRLQGKVDQYFVALGVGRHLRRWGIDMSKVTEFDWWDEQPFSDISVRFTPSRHFSGRGLTDRAKSLWGGWIFKTEAHNIYWSGDGGYEAHFQEVGERFGPFDWAFMECGQYNQLWHPIHMFPEESVQAAREAGAKRAFPVHWGGFTLALHDWTDPVLRFVAEAEKQQLPISTPRPGEMVCLGEEKDVEPWWEAVEA